MIMTKDCKWCGRSSRDVAWTRGGNGKECKTDAAWVKYHLETAEKRKEYMRKLESDPDEVTKHRELIEEFERSGRHAKRKHLSAEESTTVQGQTYLGNFWPKAVYEATFDKTLDKKAQCVWDGQTGIMLPLSTPPVAGVVSVTSLSQRKLTKTTRLPVADADVTKNFAAGSKALQTDVKTDESETNGLHLQLSMPRMPTKRKGKDDDDSDDEDGDPFGDLWTTPVKKVAKKGVKRQGEPREPRRMPHMPAASPSPSPSASSMAASAVVSPRGGSDGLTYKERQKQVAAAQSARMAALEASGFLAKLGDPLLACTLKAAKHAAVAKKVAFALAPARVQLLTAGHAVGHALTAGDAEAAESADDATS